MAKRSWNALTLRAELDSIEATLAPHLDKAKVLTASIDGKSVPISEAPLTDRIKSLMAVNPVGDDKQSAADLSITNADIAARLEKAESDLSVANATTGGLQAKIRDLETRATTAESTVQKMTAERAQVDLQLQSSQSEYARVSREQASDNAALSAKALSFGALSDLRDAGGNILPSTASVADKQAAADRIKFTAKLDALGGVCSSALLRLGVPSGHTPAQPPAGSGTQAPTMKREDFLKLDAKDQTAFLNSKGKLTD